MVFSSHLFLFYFLPVALLVYYAVPRRAQHLLLSLVSYVFYGWANPLFVPLMLGSTLTDYVSGLIISGQSPSFGKNPVSVALAPLAPRSTLQKTALGVTVVLNLCLLAFFKYFNFGVDTWNATFASLGWDQAVWSSVFRVTLPLGISFWTFHAISYVVDVYRGDAKAIRNYVDYSCYVGMFPQLVAGPIVRFQDVADQLAHRTITSEKFARGVSFFCFGLAKKILLANPCGRIADAAFGAESLRLSEAWTGAGAYAFQIYFDFSGYSDMAIGLALMLGFVFVKNFDSPYRAHSITDFWRRWHISLSTWLRDYLYIPLGGNRKGPVRTYVNLMLVMLIGGLWHGAAWTFIVWGALHGTLLCLERRFSSRFNTLRISGSIRTLVTFVILCFTWVFFRAASLQHAVQYCGAMAGLRAAGPQADLLEGIMYQPYSVLTLLAAAGITWLSPQTWDFTKQLTATRAAFAMSLLWLSIVVLTVQSYNPFIYFMF